MRRILQIGSLLLLVVGASFGMYRKEPKDAPPQSGAAKVTPPPAKPAATASKGGTPQPIPKGGARMVNPGSPAARLFRMSPEEREHAIEKLPNETQRENVRKQLAWFDSLPKEAQEAQLRRLDRFALLPPEKKVQIRQLLGEFNQLPPARRVVVQRELYQLQQMNDQQRENTLHRPLFQSRFSPDELRIINGLADAWMGPIY